MFDIQRPFIVLGFRTLWALPGASNIALPTAEGGASD